MADSNEDIGPGLRAFSIALMVIPTVAVILRIWSRGLVTASRTKYAGNTIRSKFWWDDYFCVLGLPISIATNAILLTSVDLGVGRHFKTLSPSTQLQILKILFVSYFVYDVAITLPKFSALFFYTRVFGTSNRPFAWATYFGHALVAAWLVAILIMTVFLCTPPWKYYDPEDVPGTCMNTDTGWLASAIPSVIIDVYILILPIPMLWSLQLKLTRKLLLLGVFVCGYCVILVSLGRLITITLAGTSLQEDITWIGVTPLYWLSAEAPLSILSICLPSIFFLWRRASRHGISSLLTTRNATELQAVAASKSALSTKVGGARSMAETRTTLGAEDSTDRVPFQGGSANGDMGYSARVAEGSPESVVSGPSERARPEDAIRVRNEIRVTADEAERRDEKVWV